MNIKPLGDRILVRPLKNEEIKGGIVLPDTVEKERKERGEVVALGAGEDIQKLNLKVGDKVVFGKYAGEEIEVDEVQYRFLTDEDVLAVID